MLYVLCICIFLKWKKGTRQKEHVHVLISSFSVRVSPFVSAISSSVSAFECQMQSGSWDLGFLDQER